MSETLEQATPMADEETPGVDELEETPDVDGPAEPGEEDGGEGEDTPLEGDDGGEPDEAESRLPTEKEMSARWDKLERENARHAGRLSEIMGDAATDLIQCPVCMEGIAGWIYPPDVAPLSDDAIARIRQVIGLPDLTTFRAAEDAQTCEGCGGLGDVRTGSQKPGYETMTCSRCQGTGWTRVGAVATPPPLESAEGVLITGPTTTAADDADPEIRNLRQRGFTVIPPIRVAS
jgi:hypothetical protein